MDTVLVTGGTGFLGGHLIRALRREGIAVRALARGADGANAVRALDATPVVGDLTDHGSLNAACAGVRAVFHAAADTSTWFGHNARQTAINVDGTRALVAATLSQGVREFVHTSSVASFSHLVHDTLREDTPRRGGESWINYERTKFLGEQAVWAAQRQGLKPIVLYPGHIMGPGDTRNWARLIVMIDRNALPGAPPGVGPFGDAREMAAAHVRAWRLEKFGQSYMLGGEQASFLDLIQRIARRLGRKVPQRATPAWVLRAFAASLNALSRITRREPRISPEAAVFTCHHMTVDSSKAQRELDYRFTNLDTLLDDTIAWMREAGMLRGDKA
jgi:dihydroflavonol-4-reductase